MCSNTSVNQTRSNEFELKHNASSREPMATNACGDRFLTFSSAKNEISKTTARKPFFRKKSKNSPLPHPASRTVGATPTFGPKRAKLLTNKRWRHSTVGSDSGGGASCSQYFS